MLCAVKFRTMYKKYGAIKTWNGDDEIRYIDTEIESVEYVKSYYKVIFEVDDIDDFNAKKYTYNGSSVVSVRGVSFKIHRRLSKHRYLCEDSSERGVGHIPFFSARMYGKLYIFYDFDFS